MNLTTFIDLVTAYQRQNPHSVSVADDLERICARLADDTGLPERHRRDLRAASDRLRGFVREQPDD